MQTVRLSRGNISYVIQTRNKNLPCKMKIIKWESIIFAICETLRSRVIGSLCIYPESQGWKQKENSLSMGLSAIATCAIRAGQQEIPNLSRPRNLLATGTLNELEYRKSYMGNMLSRGSCWARNMLATCMRGEEHVGNFFRSLASQGFSSGYSNVFVSACTQKSRNLRGRFIKRRLTNTPQRHRLADSLSSPYLPALVKFQLVLRRLRHVVLFRYCLCKPSCTIRLSVCHEI